MINNLAVNWVKTILRSRARGATRLTLLLANQLKTLQCVPIQVEGGEIHLDLRIINAHGYLIDYDAEFNERKVVNRLVKPGDTVFDIGAHLGLYSVLFSNLVKQGKVFAFEPNPLVLTVLEKTLSRLSNVTLLKVAASDKSETETLYVPGNQSMASLRDWTENEHGAIREFSCQTKTLNELFAQEIIELPNFIKCDVEGGETDCFRGASDLLDRADAPVIMFETNANTARGYNLEKSSAMDFLGSLEKPQYRFFQIEEDAALRRIKQLESVAANIIAAPKFREAEIVPLTSR